MRSAWKQVVAVRRAEVIPILAVLGPRGLDLGDNDFSTVGAVDALYRAVERYR